MSNDSGRSANAELSRLELGAVVDALPVGMVVLAPSGNVRYANPFARAALGDGLTAAESVSAIPAAWGATRIDDHAPYPPDEFPAVCALRGEPARVDDVELETPEGRRPFVVWSTPIRGDSGETTQVVVAFRDITQRREMERRLKTMALSDSLTGLANRLLLMDRLAQGLARLERSKSGLALLFVDLDYFKQVNDTLGHAAGDELLIQVAGRIRDTLRRHDTAARIGGDEFVVICEDVTDHSSALMLAGRLRDVLSEPYELEAGSVVVTASVGVARTEERDADPAALLQAADADMYRVKRRAAARR